MRKVQCREQGEKGGLFSLRHQGVRAEMRDVQLRAMGGKSRKEGC